MSTFDEKELKTPEAPAEVTSEEAADETLTLEDLAADVTEEPLTFTATLHFEFSDIFNAIEHIETGAEHAEDMEAAAEVPEDQETEVLEPVETAQEPEVTEPEEPATEIESDSDDKAVESEPDEPDVQESEEPIPEPDGEEPTPDDETSEPEPELDSEPEVEPESEPELEPETEPETEMSAAPEQLPDDETPNDEPTPDSEHDHEPSDIVDPAPKQGLLSKLKGQDKNTKKLLRTDLILFAIIVVSIIVGLVVANSLVDNAKAANEQKIAEMEANIKEVKLADSLYSMAADQVIDDVAVPTYSLDELYALDLREKTGFTANDLAKITRKGLVGCEEAFVKAEETYGVNSIFLISIASLESAHGTMMFRPNNMFGYGRTGFSSKEECIMTVAKGLGTRYLPPGGSLYGGSPTLKGVNKRYAANPQWYYKVGKYMQGYYAELAAEKNSALDKFE